jgi:hypothetical protein
MSVPLTNSNEHAHDSFIKIQAAEGNLKTIKK